MLLFSIWSEYVFPSHSVNCKQVQAENHMKTTVACMHGRVFVYPKHVQIRYQPQLLFQWVVVHWNEIKEELLVWQVTSLKYLYTVKFRCKEGYFWVIKEKKEKKKVKVNLGSSKCLIRTSPADLGGVWVFSASHLKCLAWRQISPLFPHDWLSLKRVADLQTDRCINKACRNTFFQRSFNTSFK